MSIQLPRNFEGVSIEPMLITARNELIPAYGGPDQRRNRMGSRYALKVKLEPLEIEDANEWDDLDTEDQTCIFAIPQPGFDTGAPGHANRVMGSGQAGASINLAGLTPHYAFRKRQWLTVITDGQRYCYRSSAEAIANEDGEITIPLRTMLRVPHLDNDPVLIGEPEMEGFVTVDEGAWAIDGNHLVQLGFTIKERE